MRKYLALSILFILTAACPIKAQIMDGNGHLQFPGHTDTTFSTGTTITASQINTAGLTATAPAVFQSTANVSLLITTRADVSYQNVASSLQGSSPFAVSCPANKKAMGGGCYCSPGYVVNSYEDSEVEHVCVCSGGGGGYAFANCAYIK